MCSYFLLSTTSFSCISLTAIVADYRIDMLQIFAIQKTKKLPCNINYRKTNMYKNIAKTSWLNKANVKTFDEQQVLKVGVKSFRFLQYTHIRTIRNDRTGFTNLQQLCQL